ncbi:MAG TPA: DUF2478 domain-containing protein, partial [Woeseiaceae bacterium]|nr:DUF2478 domain-containing protein [Woeseiaceae bacterium]
MGTGSEEIIVNSVPAAAVVYRAKVHDREALATFARELIAAGYRVAGIIQKPCFDAQGRRVR